MIRSAACVAIGFAVVVLGCASPEQAAETDAPATDVAAGAADAAAAATYGAAVTVAEMTPIKALNETPASYLDQAVRIEGTVVGVCKGSGCWVRVQQADGSEIIAKSLDHSVAVPTDCEGRSIVVQGTFKNMAAAPAEKHVEEEHAPGEAHECPEPEYLLTLDGAELGPAAAS